MIVLKRRSNPINATGNYCLNVKFLQRRTIMCTPVCRYILQRCHVITWPKKCSTGSECLFPAGLKWKAHICVSVCSSRCPRCVHICCTPLSLILSESLFFYFFMFCPFDRPVNSCLFLGHPVPEPLSRHSYQTLHIKINQINY